MHCRIVKKLAENDRNTAMFCNLCTLYNNIVCGRRQYYLSAGKLCCRKTILMP